MMCKPKENYFVAKGSSPWCNDDCWMDIDKVTNVNKSIPNQATVTCDDDVTDMNFMFIGCYNITSIDLSNVDTSNVTKMWKMFYGCSNLTTIKGVIDMKSCEDYEDMFYNCPKLKGVKIKNPPSDFEAISGLSKSQYTVVS